MDDPEPHPGLNKKSGRREVQLEPSRVAPIVTLLVTSIVTLGIALMVTLMVTLQATLMNKKSREAGGCRTPLSSNRRTRQWPLHGQPAAPAWAETEGFVSHSRTRQARLCFERFSGLFFFEGGGGGVVACVPGLQMQLRIPIGKAVGFRV